MKIEQIQSTIVKVGICEYGDKEYRVFVCKSNVFPGTADYEDEFKIREDKEISCFVIWYESMEAKENISASAGYYLHLNEAIRIVEKNLEFKKWINK